MASPTPPAGQAWPHALDPRLVKRLWQRADQPGCIRHSQARAVLSRHSRMTGGPPLAGLLQRRSGVAAGAWAEQPPIVTARPTAAAPGPPPLQVMGEGTARPAARAKPTPASGAAAAPPMSPRPPAPVPAPSRPTVRGLVQRSPAAHAAVPPAAGTEPAAAAAARPRAVNDRPGAHCRVGHPGAHARDVGHARKRDARRPGWAAWSGERRPAWITAQRRAPPIRCPARRDRRGAAPAGVGRRYPSVHCPGTPARPAAGYTPSDHRRRARAAQHAAGPACRCAEAPCRPGRGRE